jgi:predicted RNA-binding Zn-ribbon protein involved in translation (DUF1610 family)
MTEITVCSHTQMDFVDCKGGEITWRCAQCFELATQYQDTCSGG